MSNSWYSRLLPFANAPTIVRSTQKDGHFIKQFEDQVFELLKELKGSRFVHKYQSDLNVLLKLIYFLVTTGVGARTLGEEYVDLSYVSRNGRHGITKIRRLAFIVTYVLVPYLISKISKSMNSSNAMIEKILNKLTFINVLDLMNLHLALFYFSGKYYDISKRLFGMRYVFNYNPDSNSRQASGNYEIIGGLMMIQLAFKYGLTIKNTLEYLFNNNSNKEISKNDIKSLKKQQKRDLDQGLYRLLPKMDLEDNEDDKDTLDTKYKVTIVDLADSKLLGYLPEQSRSCMLCLSPMKDPACAGCGHIFCWGCILDWCKERQECPLCRARVRASQLLLLR
jgi:peroxin-10